MVKEHYSATIEYFLKSLIDTGAGLTIVTKLEGKYFGSNRRSANTTRSTSGAVENTGYD